MKPAVTVIVPIYNVERVLSKVLESVYRQTYPIEKIILIDNHSLDRSVTVARAFAARHKRIPIEVIERDKTYGVSDSYNLGAKLAKSDYVVTLHSDGIIPTTHELGKLVEPLASNPTVVAAIPYVVHPYAVWRKYNFWQKCLFATVVGTEQPSGNGKFDCYKRKIFLQLGGYDAIHFAYHVGGEDADVYRRFQKIGKVVESSARVIHHHMIEPRYALKDWIARRRFLAVSYGRHLQIHLRDRQWESLVFFVKPLLAAFSFLSFIHPAFLLPLIFFPFLYMPKMFTNATTLSDVRIIFLPFIVIFLVFYESFWILRSFLFLPAVVYNRTQ